MENSKLFNDLMDCLRWPQPFKHISYNTNSQLADTLIDEVQNYCNSGAYYVKSLVGKIKRVKQPNVSEAESICANVFLTCKALLHYQAQPWDQQILVTAKTITENQHQGCKTIADCKTYALFAYLLLKEAGLEPKIVFASYFKRRILNHVFITCNGYIVDPTIELFNQTPRAKYYHIWQRSE